MLVFGLASSAFAIHDSGSFLFEYWFNIGGGNVADLTGFYSSTGSTSAAATSQT
jgi:hypothetical protein